MPSEEVIKYNFQLRNSNIFLDFFINESKLLLILMKYRDLYNASLYLNELSHSVDNFQVKFDIYKYETGGNKPIRVDSHELIEIVKSNKDIDFLNIIKYNIEQF